MIIDTGPIIALFDKSDPDHRACHQVLEGLTGVMHTTEAVLTEVFHMLAPGSRAAHGVMDFIRQGYLQTAPMSSADLDRAFSLMDKYHDLPMDFADASLLCLAESIQGRDIFTLDFTDFSVYRVRIGRRNMPLILAGQTLLQ